MNERKNIAGYRLKGWKGVLLASQRNPLVFEKPEKCRMKRFDLFTAQGNAGYRLKGKIC